MLLMGRNLDQEIIARLKEGEDELFKIFYIKQQSRFLKWCEHDLKLINEEAMDFYQEAQMYLYENIVSGKLNKLSCDLKTYLYAIAKNQIRSRYKKLSTELKHEKDLTEHLIFLKSIDDLEEERQEKAILVKETIKNMSDPCKTILTLFYYKNFSFKSIAKMMGYKNDDVAKNQKKRCLAQLRNITKNDRNEK